MSAAHLAHAIKMCADFERDWPAAITKAQRAIRDAQAALQAALDKLNADRAARGVQPLDFL